MTSITYGSLGSLSYKYDADGRRYNVSGGFAATNIPAAQTFSYNADNSLAKVGSSTVGNDPDGDITCIGGSGCGTFSYDERGNLQQASGIGPYAIDYSYDAFGRRTEVNVGGLTSACYVYDGLNPVATTSYCNSTSGVDSFQLGTGLDELFMDTNSGPGGSSSESYLRDALNSTIALTDSSGRITSQATYDPYGNSTNSPSFGFTGRENDDASAYYPSFYYMRGRYYYPQIARFISRDPAGLAGGLNMYAYAGDDPVDFSDPTGSYPAWGGGGDYFHQTPNPSPFAGTGPALFGVQGAFVYQPLASLMTTNGLDKAVVEYYNRSQNGGGLMDVEELHFKRFYGRATLYNCCNPGTSTGEPFSPNKIASGAMPRSLIPRNKLPMFVIVRDLDNPDTRPIVVNVNDVGGPRLSGNRVIDLTPAAFRALGLNPSATTSFNAEVDVPE